MSDSRPKNLERVSSHNKTFANRSFPNGCGRNPATTSDKTPRSGVAALLSSRCLENNPLLGATALPTDQRLRTTTLPNNLHSPNHHPLRSTDIPNNQGRVTKEEDMYIKQKITRSTFVNRTFPFGCGRRLQNVSKQAEESSVTEKDVEFITSDLPNDENKEEARSKDASLKQTTACSPRSKGQDGESISHSTKNLARYFKEDLNAKVHINKHDTEVREVDSSSTEETKSQDVASENANCALDDEIHETICTVMEMHKEMAFDVSNKENVHSSEQGPWSANEMDEEVTRNIPRRKRKNEENNYAIVELKKKGRNDFLLYETSHEIVPFDSSEALNSMVEYDARKNVMNILHNFRLIYGMILQKGSFIQANQMAYKLFKERKGVESRIEKSVGSIPGIDIGDEFRLRAEMFVVGLHRQHQAGIDYIKQDGKEMAVSIVSSGRYSNNRRSNRDVLLY